jgi:deoxycytidine triphosphate deaminase
MFGNVASGAEIVSLVDEKKLTIQPFDKSRLRLAHYLLKPAGLLSPGLYPGRGKSRVHKPEVNFEEKPQHVFESQQYFLVEVEEQIVLPEGMVAQFVPSSNFIESGFGLNSGKLDPRFGGLQGKSQKLRFGVSNLLIERNTFDSTQDFIYVYFFDFRGLQPRSTGVNEQELERAEAEMKRFVRQYAQVFIRASDDGVSYDG